MDTKACSLTEDEIKALIIVYAREIGGEDTFDECLERMSYLNRRLKAFEEPEKTKAKATMTDTQTDAINAAAASNSAPKGW